MNGRRGLTLLETLIAVAILSLVAATSIPLLQKSLAVLHDPSLEIRFDELAQLADTTIANPHAVDLEPDAFSVLQPFEFMWPDHPTRPAVNVRPLKSGDGDHAWYVFTCSGWIVSRWAALDNSNQEGATP